MVSRNQIQKLNFVLYKLSCCFGHTLKENIFGGQSKHLSLNSELLFTPRPKYASQIAYKAVNTPKIAMEE